MATTKKNEVAEVGKQQAGLIVNNAFIDGMVAQIDEKVKHGLSFPKDYNYANELMGAYLVLKETKDKDGKSVLESCTHVSIANSLMKMVRSGLSMQNYQCYPIAYGGKLNIQPSVYGNTCNARRYGLKDIPAMVIYEGDVFEYHIEDAEIVIDKHTQDFTNIDTSKIVGAYAIAKMADGTKHIEIMNMSMIKQAWKQGFGYKENGNGTHQKFTDQMCLKTVKNRCLKYIIRTHGTEDVNNIYDEFDEQENTDILAEDVAYEIEQNANQVEFETIVDTEVVENNNKQEQPLPDFMVAEQ